MYCLRCGTQNQENASYCRNCRAELANSHYDQTRYSYNYSQTGDSKSTYSKPMDHEQYYNYSYKYSNNGQNPKQIRNNHQDQYSYSYNYSNNEVISGDELYLYNYIGPSYRAIKNQKISLLTLIFGPLYFLYRKLFFYTIVWLFTLTVTYYYVPNYFNIIYFAINFLLAIKFSEIYLNKAEQSVDKIKHQSLELTSQELLDKCKKRGGTLIKPITVFPFIIIASIVATIIPTIYELTNNEYTYSDNYYDNDYDNHDDYNENITPPTPKKEYIEDIEFIVPEGFVENYSSPYSRSYIYESKTDYCRMSVNVNNYVSSYNSDEEFLNNNTFIENPPVTKNIFINDVPWAEIVYLPNQNVMYFNYAHLYNNRGYIVKYDILKNNNGECRERLGNLIGSLYFK